MTNRVWLYVVCVFRLFGYVASASRVHEDIKVHMPPPSVCSPHLSSWDSDNTPSSGNHTTQVKTATKNIPRVALLFLLRAASHQNERVWSYWLAAAACSVEWRCWRMLKESTADGSASLSCYQTNNASQVAAQQYLFNLYTHTPPDQPSFPRDSLFYDTEVPDRIPTYHGHHSLTEAARLLLRQALKDPANQRFQLLSESCIPLYPAQVVYQQLILETHSRIAACTVGGSMERYAGSVH
jgi:Core-2/I-Branching enzyme